MLSPLTGARIRRHLPPCFFLDGNTWLIAVTDQRLLFLDKGMLFGLKQMEMHYEQISAISHKMSLILASVTVSTSVGTKTIEHLTKLDASKICQLVSDQIRKLRHPVPVQSQPGPQAAQAEPDIVFQLERLASLLEKGLLSEEEFATQKRKILNG